MGTARKKSRVYGIAALVWTLAGLLWVIGGIIGGNIGLYIPIGMMNICLGMMCLTLSFRGRKPQAQ